MDSGPSRYICLICRNPIANAGAECPHCKSRLSAVVGASVQLLIAVFVAMFVFGYLTYRYDQAFDAKRLDRAQQHYRQARTLFDYGYYREAASHFNEALLVERNRFEYRLGLALALYYSKQYQEAQNQLIELRALNPTDATSNLLLARLARRDEEIDQAISYYRTAIYGRWPQNTEQNRLKTRFELLDLLEIHGSAGQVIGELLTIMQEEPSNNDLARQVASLYLEFGAEEEAARVYRGLEERGANDAETLKGLARAYFALSNFQAAHDYAARAQRLESDEEITRLHDLTEEILALDPTARALTSTRRYERSREVLERTVSYISYCIAPEGDAFVGPPKPLPRAVEAMLDAADTRLDVRRPEDFSEAAEANILVAENLWSLRDRVCTNIMREDEALRNLMRSLGR